MKIRNILPALVMTLASVLLATIPAYAGNSSAGTKVGILTCKTVPDSGVNLLIHSTVDITCRFESTDGSGVEHYVGETGVGFGIDFSYDIKKQMAFTVFAADTVNGSHKLAGKYGGVGASVSAGLGGGVQLLIGGSNKSISLQPVIEGSTGIGASVGITYLFLQAQ
ncbi:MAG: DUF992 domain-containing protein [Mariprofundus sp.]|nr:DUF992 domain-containing protein [Mariprofundus sp.]